jgi:hypothetical protein
LDPKSPHRNEQVIQQNLHLRIILFGTNGSAILLKPIKVSRKPSVQEIGSDEDDIDSDDDEGQIYEGDAGKKEEENISNLLQTTWSR